MKAITSRTEMVDAGWTAARAPALLSKSYGAAAKVAGKLGAMRFLGRVRGALSLYNDYNEYKEAKAKGHIWGAAWGVTKGVMQVGFLLGGGEEIELGWNLGTMAIDGIINYKKKD